MNTWILILTLVAGHGVAIEHIEVRGQSVCEATGEAWKAGFVTDAMYPKATYVCTRKF